MRQYQKILAANNIYSYRRYLQKTLVLTGVLLFSLLTGSVFAAVAPSCPVGDQMYYYGLNPPTGAITPPNLVWNDKDRGNSYTVNGITFKLEFTEVAFLLQDYPKFGTETGVTTNAINMYHTSQKKDINHKFTASINRPISKYGFIVQDLDSNLQGRYVESISLVTNGGIFSNFRTNYFKFTNDNKTISGVGSPDWTNCGSVNCNFNIDWNSSTNNRFNANTPFTVTHGNIYQSASTTSSTGNHLMGYSDFYFCLTPPKLTVKKVLNGTRVKNTISSPDQFEIVVTGNSLAANSRITAGTGSVINSGTDTTNVLELKESTNYTITERVLNGSSLGDISNYNASYKCTNATTGSTTTMPTSAMTYNSTNQTRSFTLEDVSYSDNITCIITNTPQYTFSGTVFDDNGGITSSSNNRQNISSPFTSTKEYFNGIFDRGLESGINDTRVQIRLANCTGTTIGTTIATTSINTLGQYNFNVPKTSLTVGASVCLVEDEPAEWDYSVDTTANQRSVTITNGKYAYDNLDFGEVKADNTALVLIKSQYVHQCNANLDYSATIINESTDNPTIGFSTEPIGNVPADQCIAYRIEAYNRGHVSLNDVQIRDPLPSTKSSFTNPTPKGVPTNIYTGTTLPTAKVITSNTFNLAAAVGSATKETLYFNTKYGTIVDP